jgi:hypothetical protein
MWCCVGSGIESQSKYGEFIYAHEKDVLFVNLYTSSTLEWHEKGVRITQTTRFPDADTSSLKIDGDGVFTVKLRYPGWVARAAMQVKDNGKPVKVNGKPGSYVSVTRHWRKGDRVDVTVPMRTTLERLPDQSNYYAVLRGPIVLAAKTQPFPNEKLNVFAGDSGSQVPSGPVCPLEAAPMFVSDTRDFVKKFKAVKGEPMTFTAPGLIQGGGAAVMKLIPFFRLHDSRYMIYWPYSTPASAQDTREATAKAEAERIALDAQTIDQVAPGEQQPESDHAFAGEGADAGVAKGKHWRHASGWFSYVLNDRKLEAKTLRLTFSGGDSGPTFDVLVNGREIATVTLEKNTQEFYTKDVAIPAELLNGSLTVKFVAKPGSIAGGLYGLRLLR